MCAMARSLVARRADRYVPAFWRACATAAAVIGTVALPLIAASPALANPVTSASASPPLAVTVTSVSPAYATEGQTITIRGRVWNGTRATMRDLSVSVLSSTVRFTSNIDLEAFAGGATGQVAQNPVGIAPYSIGHVRSRHSVAWIIRLPAGDLHLSCFGVYPLTVTATNASQSVTASQPVPLPFWPSKADLCPSSLRPAPFPISWIWPLIDSPHAGPCPGLLDNSLTASVAPGGRLANLLAVGRDYTTKARLTWAIDPALLDNVRTMTGPYQVGSSPACAGATAHPGDRAARNWLAEVAKATAGQPVFVTPYADVDMAALARYGNDTDLRKAFADGQRLAGPILRRSPAPAPIPASSKKLSAIAWPADGRANPEVLEDIGAMHIGTVILAMPPTSLNFTPGAVTSVVDGVGNQLKVLLADGALSGLLASRSASSTSVGTIFDVSQLYLAETAMIVAEAPAMVSPILVTPPRRWDPTATLAAALLSDTTSAPWLRPSTIGELASQPEEHYFHSLLLPPHPTGELSRGLLHKVMALDSKVSLLQSIMQPKDPQLSRAVFGIESSSWVGRDSAQARTMLNRTSRFVTGQFAGLSVGGPQTIHVTLGGRAGSVTVSIHNGLGYAVRVGLRVSSSNDTVMAKQKHPNEVYVVPAHSSSELKLNVNATQTGKATLKLSLKAPNGRLLPDPPDNPLLLEISATNLGTVALVICAAALAIFVIASAAQAIRRGRRDRQTQPDQPDSVDTEQSPTDRSGLSTAGPPPGHLPQEESQ
jgi:Family of unknown function (DUF6049)